MDPSDTTAELARIAELPLEERAAALDELAARLEGELEAAGRDQAGPVRPARPGGGEGAGSR